MNQLISQSTNQGAIEPMKHAPDGINESMRFFQPHPPKVPRFPQLFCPIWSAHRTAATVSRAFRKLHLPIVFRSLPIFASLKFEAQIKIIEMQIELSLQAHAHFAHFILQECSDPSNRALATVSSSKPAPCTSVFCGFYVRASPRYSGAHVLPKLLQMRQFLHILTCKPSSRHSPVHFLLATFRDRASLTQPRKRPYPKIHRVTRSRPVTLPTTWWWVVDMMGGWHDDVVDMMVGMLTIVHN